ncbi:GntR family transcriptional regulator, partial [Clostridium chrysemydis]
MIEEIIKVQFKEDTPKYKCIGLKIKELIDKNIIKDGEKLPSIRELKEALNVNKVTIINAYNYLLNKGY